MGKSLKTIANESRKDILSLGLRLASNGVHLGGCFSLIEILTVLYQKVAVISNDSFTSQKRDRIILSKGHGSIAQYVAMLHAGLYDSLEDFSDLLGPNNCFYKQSVRNPEKGLEFSSGSLGQGLAYGIGIAWSLKNKNNDVSRVYVIHGDGECDEGSVWEAASIAGHLKLNNITVIVDRNRLQIDGNTEDINSMSALQERWEAFGFYTVVIDGHNFDEIEKVLMLRNEKKPIAIIANTVKGKGISFTENEPEWHQNILTDELYKKGIQELCAEGEEGY